ncbi:MAG: hypothetical protein A2052_06955 [Deltaproteobacteria bacterium GWA2_54_12]|nr:MAG: hypothetical protein A2052_06955 [Deltaproteobacteria bacterium GWA2_54_12]
MKRIILSVFAAAVTAAWVVPASAADVTFSGQYRLRGEYTNNNNFNDAVSDDSDVWAQRVRLTANAKATDDVSAKITLQDTRTWGATGAAGLLSDSGNTLDFHEAYLNVSSIFGTPVSFRAGRQELSYGDERLIGSFGWSNQGRAFDGAKFMFATDALNVDFFTTTITEAGVAGDDTYFSGIYATLKQLVPNNTLDVYVLNQNSGSSTTQNLYTIGARLKGAVAGVDYTAEVPFQFGENSATQDISAWAFAVKAGYTLPTPMKIRVGAEYDFATGEDTADADLNAFQGLYPTNHGHFGIADVTGANQWSNIQAWSVNASADLNEKTRLFVAYWDFSQDEAAAVGNFTGANDDLGSEIDLVATYKYNNNLNLEAGASRFFVGDAGVGTDDRDWAYLQITANF